MKVVVIGATGSTGKHAVEQALRDGHEVTVLARDPAKVALTHARLAIVKGDGTNAADVEAVLAGQDAVISTIGPTQKNDAGVRARAARVIVDAMQKLGVTRLVWVSIGGVGDSRAQMQRSSFVFGRIIMPLFMKKVFDDAEAAERIITASGLEWTLVRPVQLVDKSTAAAVGATLGDEKLTRLQIARADLAGFLVGQLASPTFVQKAPVVYA